MMNVQEWLAWLEILYPGRGVGTCHVTPQINNRPPQINEQGGGRYRKHSFAGLPTRNYTYGALEPTVNLDLVNQQIYLAHRYRNQLVEVELARRHAITVAQSTRDQRHPELADLVAQQQNLLEQIEQLRKQIKGRNALARTKVGCADLREEITDCRQHLRDIRLELKNARQVVKGDPKLVTDCEQVQQKAAAVVRDRRAAVVTAGLYWPSYLCVERSVSGSTDAGKWRGGFKPRTMIIKDLDGLEVSYESKPDDPRFHRFTGEGLLAVQKQTPSGHSYLTPYEAHTGASNLVQINHVQGKYFLVKMRIGTQSGAPLWTEIPVKMHRPLPPDTYITWVKLLKRKIGTHWRWHVQFTLAKPSGWERPRTATGLKLAVNLGWRWRPQGLRVAYWLDSTGQQGEILLPWEQVERYQFTQNLQSIRTNLFNVARERLVEWLASHEVPDWLREATATLTTWHSPARLARLVIRWREQRFTGDQDIFAMLEQAPLDHQIGHGSYHAWRNQDRHLYDWQSFRRLKVEGYRQNLFRNIARNWADTYDNICLAQVDYADLRRDPEPEEEPDLVAKTYRNLASPGLFARLICEAAGDRVRLAKATNLTRTCHHCANLVDGDGRNLVWTCNHCGTTYDIDYNHCRNLLHREGDSAEQVSPYPDGDNSVTDKELTPELP